MTTHDAIPIQGRFAEFGFSNLDDSDVRAARVHRAGHLNFALTQTRCQKHLQFYNLLLKMAYSVPLETEKLFKEGILDNPMIKHDLPEGCLEAASKITFEGSDSPSLPINWRFAESISSLKALEAAVLNVLLKKKYGIGPVEVKINTFVCPAMNLSVGRCFNTSQRPRPTFYHVQPPLDPRPRRRSPYCQLHYDPGRLPEVHLSLP